MKTCASGRTKKKKKKKKHDTKNDTKNNYNNNNNTRLLFFSLWDVSFCRPLSLEGERGCVCVSTLRVVEYGAPVDDL